MEEIYINVEHSKPAQQRPPTTQTRPRSSEKRFNRVVVFFPGLLSVLLLAGLIGLAVLSAELSACKANVNETLLASESEFRSLTEEIEWLNTSLTEVTKELEALTAFPPKLSAAALLCEKICPAGWRLFQCSCYLLSNDSDSWSNGREDCRSRGADLVVIESTEEQTFLSDFTDTGTMAWIGLTDTVKEGTWKWVSGAPLTLKYWRKSQPDNYKGELGDEDCAHVTSNGSKENWNDLFCGDLLKWICEKSPEHRSSSHSNF